MVDASILKVVFWVKAININFVFNEFDANL
jgi:hypothetical protein